MTTLSLQFSDSPLPAGRQEFHNTMPQLTFKKIISSKPLLLIEFGLLALLGFYFGKEMLAENATQQEIQTLESELQQLEHSKNELSALLEYVKTDEFVANEAREKLNLVQAGEQLVVIPDVDATPEEVAQTDEGTKLSLAETVETKTSNAKLWWQYFFDRKQLPLE